MKKRFVYALSLLGILVISSCANVSNKPETLPQEDNHIPEVNTPIENQVIEPTTGFIKGDEDKVNLKKEEIYSRDGEIMLPFDQAYPEFMNQAFYDKNSVLVKSEDTKIQGIADKLKDLGVTSFESVTKVDNNISWYKLNLKDVKSSDVINTFRNAKTDALMFDLNYVIDEKGLYTVTTSVDSTTPEPGISVDNCNIPNAESNIHFKDQYYFKDYGFKEGYQYLKENNIPEAGNGVTVAVIDTGVKLRHKDLRDNIWVNKGEVPNNHIDDDGNGYVDDVNGWNFVTDNSNPNDDQGHGTHVAGIIAAKNNHIGIVGVAYNAKIMALKAGDSSGNFTDANIAKAIEYAYINGADVINMSFGGAHISQPVQDALKAASKTSCLVAAAGNDGNANEEYETLDDDDIDVLPSFPASLNYVIGVMSCDKSRTESVFTNFDGIKNTTREYEVYAPGVEVYSTFPDGDDDDDDDDDEDDYEILSGTSMSAPVVSGMLAILRARFADRKTYDAKFLMGQLISTANIPIKCCDDDHGHHNMPNGVNLYEALFVDAKPEINMVDYRFFDLKTLGRNNNEDFNLDVGETGYFAPVLRNKWGTARNVTINFRLDTSVDSTIANYIKLENTTLNYNDIASYSSKDYFLLDSSNTGIIGCDTNNSLKITVADNLPKNVTLTLLYDIKSNNKLVESDQKEYITPSAVDIEVNCAETLPKIIDKNLTLTKDKHYIISDKTFIQPNVTLSLEPGANIEFIKQKGDSYGGKDTVGSLEIRGTLYANGTKDNLARLKGISAYSSYDLTQIKIYHEGIIDLTYCCFENFSLTDEYLSRISLNYCNVNHCSFDKINATYCSFNGSTMSFTTSITHSKFTNCNQMYALAGAYNTFIHNELIPYDNSYVDHSLLNTLYVKQTGMNDDRFYNIYLNAHFNLINSERFRNIFIRLKDLLIKDNKGGTFQDPFNITQFELLTGKDTWPDIYKMLLLNKAGKYYLIDGTELHYSQYKDSQDYRQKNLYNNLEENKNKDGMIELHFSMYGGKPCVDYFYPINLDMPNNISIEVSPRYKLTDENFVKLQNMVNIAASSNTYNACLSSKPEDLILKTFQKDDDHKITYNNAIYIGSDDKQLQDNIAIDGNDEPYKNAIGFANSADPELAKLWPFVLKCEFINQAGQQADTFNNERLKIRLTFNRDMDITTKLNVSFGLVETDTYDDYEIAGNYIDARTWEGTYLINTMVQNGRHGLQISNGYAAENHFFDLTEAPGRFKFNIDTTSSLAQVIKGHALDNGIQLDLAQDDYAIETFMGYNIYRSTSKDGNYTRINRKVINKKDNTYLDTDVLPGEVYWYTFTIVMSDLSETRPSAKISVRAKDTMAPNIFHSPVYQGYTNENFTIKCSVSDNINVSSVKLYYRSSLDSVYKVLEMNKANNTYSALIPANEITIDGIDYYIEASDGTNTVTKGTALDPYHVIIKENAIISNLGDVDGDGQITVKDAYMILRHISGEIILEDEQFRRANLNKNDVLETVEALRILQYINGKVPSLEM